MSKISPRQRYAQLMEWLATTEQGKKNTKKASKKQSRMSYYKNKGVK